MIVTNVVIMDAAANANINAKNAAVNAVVIMAKRERIGKMELQPNFVLDVLTNIQNG